MFFKALRQCGSALLYDEDKTIMLLETVSFEETSCKPFTNLVRFCLIHYDISSEAERGGQGGSCFFCSFLRGAERARSTPLMPINSYINVSYMKNNV